MSRIRHRELKTMNNTTNTPERLSCIRFVRWLWGFVSCCNCSRFGFRRECLVERPDGLHDNFMLCSKCSGMGLEKLQRELYPPNTTLR